VTFTQRHRIAGVTITTESDVTISHLIEEPFAQFRCSAGESGILCRFRRIAPEVTANRPLRDREKDRVLQTVAFPAQWLDKPVLHAPEVRAALIPCLEHPESVHLDLRWNRAIIFDFRSEHLHRFYPEEDRQDITGPRIVASFRNLLAPFWPKHSGVLVHAAGVVRGGKAAVFLAPDEGGKSTLTKTLDHGLVLNDDHLILRHENRHIFAHATPFGCLTDGPGEAEIGAFFLLEKGPGFELSPVGADAVLAYLLKENSRLFLHLPNEARVKAFEVLAEACSRSRTYRLRCARSQVDWAAIDVAMGL